MILRFVVALAVMAGAIPVAAQSVPPPSASPATHSVDFLSRFDFSLAGELLSSDDTRFVWDTNFGAELDLVDYGIGRAMFVTNYEAVLGEELRRFDPNQGNYILEGSMSVRASRFEVAGVFYHQSRHLADRPKRDPVDWNMLGGRVRRDWKAGPARFDARADLRGVLKRSHVDYRWEFDGRVRSDLPIASRVGLLVAAAVRRLGVDGSANRGDQTGFRGEGGVRVEGRAAAMELFLAAERRIDPYPLTFEQATWVTAGFRVTTH